MLLLPLYSRVTHRASSCHNPPAVCLLPVDEGLGWIHRLGSQNCSCEGRARAISS